MATTNFGTYHLADNPKSYQPIRTNNFRFLVSGLDSLLRVAGDANDRDDYITNGQEVIDFSVVSFSVPDFQQNVIDVNRGNSTVHFAGKASFGTGSLVINDFAGADGKSVLRAWQALSYNVVDDTIPSSDVYKKDDVTDLVKTEKKASGAKSYSIDCSVRKTSLNKKDWYFWFCAIYCHGMNAVNKVIITCIQF